MNYTRHGDGWNSLTKVGGAVAEVDGAVTGNPQFGDFHTSLHSGLLVVSFYLLVRAVFYIIIYYASFWWFRRFILGFSSTCSNSESQTSNIPVLEPGACHFPEGTVWDEH